MMESLLIRRKNDVRSLLAAHRHLVEALRDALLERHELIGREIDQVLQQASADHLAARAPGEAQRRALRTPAPASPVV